MNQLFQLIVYGVVQGATLALISAGFWLIYSTTRTFHLAHSLSYSIAGYAVFICCSTLGLPIIVGALAAILFAALSGIAIDAFFYQPLRKRGGTVLSVFLVSLGVATAGAALMQLVFGPQVRQIPNVANVTWHLGNVSLTSLQALSTITSAITLVAVWLFATKTRSGHSLTAVRSNSMMAMTVGINVKRASLVVFGLGSAMAAVAAFFETVTFVAYPTMGLQPIMYGVIGVFLGGIGSFQGAALGGFFLGFLTVFSGLFLSQNLGVILVFAVLLGIVVFRPGGIIRTGGEV